MSIYVTPVALSLMMWLILMVEIPGVTTTPMAMVPRGTSEATSNSSGVHRQAVTPAKLHGRVVGCMTANACTGEECLGGWESSMEKLEALLVQSRGAELAHSWPQGLGWLGDLPSSHDWLGWMQNFFPPQKLWASLCGWLWYTGCLGDIGRKGLQTLILLLLGKGHSPEHLSIREGEIPLHLLPQLLHALC